MFDSIAFGEKLRGYRMAKNLTQDEVGEIVGVSGQYDVNVSGQFGRARSPLG